MGSTNGILCVYKIKINVYKIVNCVRVFSLTESKIFSKSRKKSYKTKE